MKPRFQVGDGVRVRDAWPEAGPARVHVRTPHYLRGKAGVVERVLGAFPNPEELAFGKPGLPARPLYHVRFRHRDLWPAVAGAPRDTLMADVYEHWLEPKETRHG
ncbi:MAG: SH3-like domain-containing protein [Pseudomonadota bacterium]